LNKKGTMPDWLIALILAIAVLLIVLVFILGPYKEGISTYVLIPSLYGPNINTNTINKTAIAVLLIVLVFILGPYKEGISTYVRDNILGSLGGGR